MNLSMAQRVDLVIAQMKRTGTLRQDGDYWHMVGLTGALYNRETVIEGEPPILLPTEEDTTHVKFLLSLEDVRRIIQRELEEENPSYLQSAAPGGSR